MLTKIITWTTLAIALAALAASVYLSRRRVYPSMPTQLTKTHYKPVAIMGIDFGENVSEDFRPGQHYVLKVFHVNGGEVAFGFSQIDTEGPAK
jgi:hypothetical protein